MDRIFTIQEFKPIPDGTLLSPFMNAKDTQSDLSIDLPDCFSLSAGKIEPRTRSKIHIMPFITMVTFLRCGRLTLTMKGPKDKECYRVPLKAGQAALTEWETFIQLINDGDKLCRTLYVTSPACLFEQNADNGPRYDDSLVLDEDWEQLAGAGWKPSRLMPTMAVTVYAILDIEFPRVGLIRVDAADQVLVELRESMN